MRPGFIDGLVLAAVAAEDRAAAAVRGGLPDALSRALEERLQALDALGREARRAEVKRLAARLRPIDPDADLPPRAAAILASEVPRALGRKWVAQAPEVRRGFRVNSSLRATLRRLAQPASPDGAEQVEGAAWRK